MVSQSKKRIRRFSFAVKIVILDDGKIHRVGTHKELLSSDPIYQEIYASQMKGGNDNGSEE